MPTRSGSRCVQVEVEMTLKSTKTLTGVLKKLAKSATNNKQYYTAQNKDDSSYKLSSLSIQLLNNQDPFDDIVANIAGTDVLTTITTDQCTLLKSLPHLYNLNNSATVINVDLNLQDYSIIAVLKDLNYISFVSNDIESAVENGQLAYKIAFNNNTPVLHFINFNKIGTAAFNVQLTLLPFENDQEKEKVVIEDVFFKELNKNDSAKYLIVNLSPYGKDFTPFAEKVNSILVDVNIYRPWKFLDLLSTLPTTIEKIIVIQSGIEDSTARFAPLLLDFFNDFNILVERNIKDVILTNVGTISKDFEDILEVIVANANKTNPDQHLYLGKPLTVSNDYSKTIKNVLSLETAYIKVLNQLFNNNLKILNEYNNDTVNIKSPEFGFGGFLKVEQDRETLLNTVKSSLDTSLYPSAVASELVQLLSQWVEFHQSASTDSQITAANDVANKIFDIISANKISKLLDIAPTVESFIFKNNWLIGSDAWSYDLGNSGVHHVLASKKNINMLIIDSEPYDEIKKRESNRHKKNVGLYAMNFHDVYVASVAVYSSYTQLLTAFIEAASYQGPSVVLAYLPYHSENDSPLEVLKETKNAVESGYWPLYRYDPRKEDSKDLAFQLDSAIVKKELQDFLDRENKLTLLTNQSPQLATTIQLSATDVITRKQEKRSKQAFDQLLEGLSGPPLHIYYASDGGNATAIAKKLARRGASVGLKTVALSMDDIILEELAGEENVIFVTSTAGQGEFPQDGKAFWEELKSSTDIDLASLNFSVFGLGDSQYWPRKEDARYYNKPAKDLFAKLELLSAKPLAPLGLGDDQDADGFNTGYNAWEPQVWEGLGISGEGLVDEKPYTNEDMKINSDFLRGTIVESIADQSTLDIHPHDSQLTKFHGCYIQDDRDIREIRKQQGLEPLFSFMTRIRLPGGVVNPDQWLVMDRLSNETGNGTIKVTTRATFQLHGILKKDIKHSIRAMNSTLMDTVAACGDVNRNVMCSVIPANAKVHKQVSEIGAKISESFLPNTTAYYEIWLEGADERDYDKSWPEIYKNRKEGPTKKKTLVAGNTLVDVEPLYSPVYLPRKFKVNITVPPYNDVDVWSSDVGLIAIVDPETSIVTGYNLYVGGGMGTTHGNKKTYPRRGSIFGFITPEQVIPAIKAVFIIQRDNGSRTDRKHARLKYTIDDMGVSVFKTKAEEICGFQFAPERPYEIKSNCDYFGWVKDETGLNHFTAFIENGRVADTPDKPQKTGLKKVAEYMKKTGSGNFRLTGNQHVLIASIKDEHLDDIKAIMKKYSLDNTELSGIRQSSSSCVGLPTCGLAMAESERYLPVLMTDIEAMLEEFGLRHDAIVMRMTGCPNGCSRPWLAELALIGKAPNVYNMMLGGGFYGERLNKLYRANVRDDDILDILRPLFKRWAMEREDGEHFGDFCVRVGIIKPTLEGKYFHDDIAEDAF